MCCGGHAIAGTVTGLTCGASMVLVFCCWDCVDLWRRRQVDLKTGLQFHQ